MKILPRNSLYLSTICLYKLYINIHMHGKINRKDTLTLDIGFVKKYFLLSAGSADYTHTSWSSFHHII